MKVLILVCILLNITILNTALGFGPPKSKEVRITSEMIRDVIAKSNSSVGIKAV